jgi:hypothetical protein
VGAKGDEGLSPEPAQWRIIFLGPGGTFENFKPSRFRGAELPEISYSSEKFLIFYSATVRNSA